MPRKGGSNLKKAPGTAVDSRNGQKATITRKTVEKFDPPAGLTPRSVAAWEAYWDDPVSALLTPSDKIVLVRWIELIDHRERLLKEADQQPIVLGSTRQQQAHPFFALSMTFEKAVQALEAQLGIGPKNRAALGIAVIAEQRGLDDLNRDFDDEDEDDEDDPRKAAAVPGTVEP